MLSTPKVPTRETWGSNDNPGPARAIWKHVETFSVGEPEFIPSGPVVSFSFFPDDEFVHSVFTEGEVPNHDPMLNVFLEQQRAAGVIVEVVPCIDRRNGEMAAVFPRPDNDVRCVSVVALRETVQIPAV